MEKSADKPIDQLSNQQLLDARNKHLAQADKSSLRPHGKLWGMDVFSWYNPLIYEIENVLHSFPAPVIWIANSEDIQKLMTENPSCFSNVKMVCCHDHAQFALVFEKIDLIESYFATSELNDVLKMLRTFKKENGIILLTSRGANWENDKIIFETFLDIQQSK